MQTAIRVTDPSTLRVLERTFRYREHWRAQPGAYWLTRLHEEVAELTLTLDNQHPGPVEHELEQIASICLNWLRKRELRLGALRESPEVEEPPAPPLPWQRPELSSWRIVGMNHYSSWGLQHIFVAMTNADESRVIRVEGPDSSVIWGRLAEKAAAATEEPPA